jgi:hypothetical protein
MRKKHGRVPKLAFKTTIKKEKKDTFTKDFFNSSRFIWVLLICILTYWYLSNSVINLPDYFFGFKIVLTLLFYSCFIIWRYLKYKEYYKRKLKDRIYVSFMIIILTVFTFIGQGIVETPFSAYIIYKSKKNPLEKIECEITNCYHQGIQFVYNGKRYSRYFNSREKEYDSVIKNYSLILNARPSVLGTYYIESFFLKQK